MKEKMSIRQTEIISRVSEAGRISVSGLAQSLGISEVTVRKDLKFLAEKGILRKEQGYAALRDAEDIRFHMALHYESKRLIAESAAEFVGEGETIMVESGSTCIIFAMVLAETGRRVNIITNSAYLAELSREWPNIQLIMLGGEYQKSCQAVVGPLTKMGAGEFRVGKIFVGTDGYSEKFGFTGDDMTRAETVRAMTKCAARTFVLAEASKFLYPGTVSFLQPQEVSVLITDEELGEEQDKQLRSHGVRILTTGSHDRKEDRRF